MGGLGETYALVGCAGGHGCGGCGRSCWRQRGRGVETRDCGAEQRESGVEEERERKREGGGDDDDGWWVFVAAEKGKEAEQKKLGLGVACLGWFVIYRISTLFLADCTSPSGLK